MAVRLRITTEIPQEVTGEAYQCSGCDEIFTLNFIPDFCPLCGREVDFPAVENPREAAEEARKK